jgi:hypothetical protein
MGAVHHSDKPETPKNRNAVCADNAGEASVELSPEDVVIAALERQGKASVRDASRVLPPHRPTSQRHCRTPDRRPSAVSLQIDLHNAGV